MDDGNSLLRGSPKPESVIDDQTWYWKEQNLDCWRSEVAKKLREGFSIIVSQFSDLGASESVEIQPVHPNLA